MCCAAASELDRLDSELTLGVVDDSMHFVVVDTVCIILVVVYIQINARGVNQIKSSLPSLLTAACRNVSGHMTMHAPPARSLTGIIGFAKGGLVLEVLPSRRYGLI